jgi:hypothetical protein
VPSATCSLEPVADAQVAGRRARDRRRRAQHDYSCLVRHDARTRVPASGAPRPRPAHDTSARPPEQPSTPSALIAAPGHQRGHLTRPPLRAATWPLCGANGAVPAASARWVGATPDEDRSPRRASHQPHVADANLLVRALFRGRAPDNRDCHARSACRPRSTSPPDSRRRGSASDAGATPSPPVGRRSAGPPAAVAGSA